MVDPRVSWATTVAISQASADPLLAQHAWEWGRWRGSWGGKSPETRKFRVWGLGFRA